MKNKSYWIWQWGDYEIYHIMKANLAREERGVNVPAFWKLSTPSVSVRFFKMFESDAGYLICHFNGDGCVMVDNKRYGQGVRIELAAGAHKVEATISNPGALSAMFVESDVCPSDETWVCNDLSGDLKRVGYNEYFDSFEKNPEIFPFEYKNIKPIGKEKYGDGVLFEFDTELFGYLNISGVSEKDEIGVFYGESREEAIDTEYSYITDFVSGEKTYRLRQRALRYVYLTGVSENVEVSVEYEYLPLEALGSFKCENELLNRVCEAAAYTFHLNCREGFFDGIKRDRWIWSGDAYQSARINRYLFADKEIEQRTLIGLVGKSPVNQHINTILDYSQLWIIMLYEHYMAYGDNDFLLRIYPMASELLRFTETRFNSDGFIEGKGDWTFIDWSKIDKCGAVCAEQMLLIQAYKVMAELSAVLGTGEYDELMKKSIELKKRTNEFYWSKEKGAYIDSYKSGANNVTRHANIFAVMYDIADGEQTESIKNNVLKNDNILKITTPYFAGYEYDALAKLGEFDLIESRIISYYGSMIELGAKTVWEEYDPDKKGIEHYAMYGGKYHKSLCHAWGAGPIYLFGRYYLGVYATSAGYETFNVEPQLGGLGEISGSVSVNGGTVTLTLDRKELSVMSTKAGGTLLWAGNRYELIPNKEFIVKL